MLPIIFCSECHTYISPQKYACPVCHRPRQEDEKLPDPDQPLWCAKLGGAVRGAVISGDLVIFNYGERSGTGGLAAFHRIKGELVWEFKTPHSVEAGVVREDDRLFFATCGFLNTGSEVYCLEAKTGKEIWKQPLSTGAWTRPVVTEVRLYLGQEDGQILCFDNRDGKPLCFQGVNLSRGRVWLELVKEHLVALTGKGTIQKFDPLSLQPAWHSPLQVGYPITSAPCQVKGRLYFGGDQGRLFSLDVGARQVNLLADDLISVVAAPGKSHTSLFVGAHDHQMHAFDLKTGQPAWQKNPQFEHSISSVPFAGDDLVVICINRSGIALLEAQTGQVAWIFPVPEKVGLLSDPLMHDGVIYAGTDKGDVYALPWHLGHYAWSAPHLKGQGKYFKAGVHYACAGFQTRSGPERDAFLLLAERCWDEDGHPEWAARLWEGWGKLLKAAKAYERAAEMQCGLDNYQAAEFYYAASRLYWRLGDFQAMDACAKEAAKLGRWPLLRLTERNNPVMTQGKMSWVSFRADNIGYGPAKELNFSLAGSLHGLVTCEVLSPLLQERHFDISLEITPTRALDDLKIEAEYTGSHPRPTPFSTTLKMSIEAAKPPHKIKLGGQMFGNIKIVNENGEPVDIELGDGFNNDVEVILGKEQSVNASQLTCPDCNHPLPENTRCCDHCGMELE